MKKVQISKERIEKIARNINAMDITFEYCDDFKRYKFWRNLKKKLDNILENLSENEKKLSCITLSRNSKKILQPNIKSYENYN